MARAPLITTDAARTFWSACSEDRFIMPRCGRCGHLRWYLQPACPHCSAIAYQWVELSGQGRVLTFTVVHRAFDPGFIEDVPYVSALVTLDEDQEVRFVTRIVGCDPRDVRVGMGVAVTFVTDELGTRLPLFAPAASESLLEDMT